MTNRVRDLEAKLKVPQYVSYATVNEKPGNVYYQLQGMY